MRGLSVISDDGTQSPLISGAPKGHRDDAYRAGPLQYGTGWLLDVAIHPDYERNGWIYISHGHRCENCGGSQPKSMGRLIRGRIKDQTWVDEQIIWQAERETYSAYPDMALGGWRGRYLAPIPVNAARFQLVIVRRFIPRQRSGSLLLESTSI